MSDRFWYPPVGAMGEETYFLASPGHAMPVDEKVYVCNDELEFPVGFCRTGSENVSKMTCENVLQERERSIQTIKNGICNKTARIDSFPIY